MSLKIPPNPPFSKGGTNQDFRALAAQMITAVVRDKHSLTFTSRDHGLVKAYGYGVLRWYHRLKIIADALIFKPLRARDQDIAALLWLGLYQLIYMRTPVHAAVSATVEAAQTLKKPWAKGLINQALHQFLNHSEKFLQQADATLTGRFSHPQWLIDALQTAWPQQWPAILTANNQPAPLFLRVNAQQNSRDAYMQRLQQQGIECTAVAGLPQAVVLTHHLPVDDLPGFYDGCCSVQDLAGQFVAPWLDLQPRQRILDACAAPGSKTSHILEIAPDLSQLVAIDHDPLRLQRVKDNIQRLKLSAPVQLLSADAADPSEWWDGLPFDRILVDAPCSGTGVIRRHPDIKVLRQVADMAEYARNQLALLTALWPLLKSGGRLLYTTCSVLPEENTQVIERFCRQHLGAVSLPIETDLGVLQPMGRQVFPEEQTHDGFYYALLQKTDYISL